MSADSTPTLAPGALASPGTPGGPKFALSTTEWLAIQTYVTDALALPITPDAFRKSLGAGAPSDLSDFQSLIDCYKGINAHCTTWQNETYPASVSLASDVSAYGSRKAPLYYGAIQKEADILIDDPDNAAALKALKGILDNLTQQAQTYADNAARVYKQIQDFANQTAADKTTLLGPDGNSGLVKKYNDKYGSTSTEVQQLTKQIADQQAILKSATDEYNHDVIVAATSPTYAWVFPAGTIAAAVVAGVYGKRATDALDLMHATQAKIKTMTDQVAADANLMIAIHNAEIGMSAIGQELAEALPVIQKIQGLWGAIKDDLQGIVALIDADIRKALPIIMNLGIAEAIQAWKDVADEADTYRKNAYITVDGKTQAPATVAAQPAEATA
ncbi:alpha-xenorhabdolysin family binary toxin subunit A [Hymenobacter coalescens]